MLQGSWSPSPPPSMPMLPPAPPVGWVGGWNDGFHLNNESSPQSSSWK